MDLAFERGSLPCLRSFIADYGNDLLASTSQTVRERFRALQHAADEGTAREHVSGRYSLLKIDHPFNLSLVAKGIVEDPGRQLTRQPPPII
jgi:hypothetical protein